VGGGAGPRPAHSPAEQAGRACDRAEHDPQDQPAPPAIPGPGGRRSPARRRTPSGCPTQNSWPRSPPASPVPSQPGSTAPTPEQGTGRPSLRGPAPAPRSRTSCSTGTGSISTTSRPGGAAPSRTADRPSSAAHARVHVCLAAAGLIFGRQVEPLAQTSWIESPERLLPAAWNTAPEPSELTVACPSAP